MLMPKPNFLILMADQLTPGALPAYGNAVARTPNLDSLAAGGITFRSAYCNSPLCAPSHFRSEEHTSELQSRRDLVCRLLLEKKQSLRSRQFLAARSPSRRPPSPRPPPPPARASCSVLLPIGPPVLPRLRAGPRPTPRLARRP